MSTTPRATLPPVPTPDTAIKCERFIVGMSRGGTSWLTVQLNRHSQVAAFGETAFWGRLFVEPGVEGEYDAAQLELVRQRTRDYLVSIYTARLATPAERIGELMLEELDRVAPPANPADAFHAVARGVARAEGKSVVVEKTPHHMNFIDRILKHIPSAKFVLMIRAGYAFMNSYKHQGDRKPPRVRKRFERRYHPIACAIIYRKYLLSAIQAQAEHGDRVLAIRTVELSGNQADVLERVQRFYDVPVEDICRSTERENSSFPVGPPPELSAADQFWLNVIAGRVMRKDGQELRQTPRLGFAVLVSIGAFVPWLAWNLFDLRNRIQGSTLRYLASWLRATSR